jgi:hypothetical protein
MKKLIMVMILLLLGCSSGGNDVDNNILCKKSKISDTCFCCIIWILDNSNCSIGRDASFTVLPCDEAEYGFGFKVIK